MSTAKHGPTYRRTGPVKESFAHGTVYEIDKRIDNFLAAMKNPMKRIGEKRAQRKINPDYTAPEPKKVERFEQRNREDRWSKTTYDKQRGPAGSPGRGGEAHVSVQDPNDPTDEILPPITVEEEK